MTNRLAIAVGACAAATLVHHAHNAHFLAEYPALAGRRVAGLALLALYAIYALDGLVHYLAAPLSAHSPAMNVTIWLEALTGLMLAWTAFFSRSARPSRC